MHISLLPLWNAINDNSNGNGNNGNDDYDGGNGSNNNNSSNGIDDSWRSTCAIVLSAASTMNMNSKHTHGIHKPSRKSLQKWKNGLLCDQSLLTL